MAPRETLNPAEISHCKRFVKRVAKIYAGDDFRVTLFGPAGAKGISPLIRFDPTRGEAAEVSRPDIVFERGWPVAGLAWEHAGAPVILVLQTDPDEDFFADGLKLPRGLARAIAASRTMRRVKQILCVGVPRTPFPLVLSVDTFAEEGLGCVSERTFQLRHGTELHEVLREFVRVVSSEWRDRAGGSGPESTEAATP